MAHSKKSRNLLIAGVLFIFDNRVRTPTMARSTSMARMAGMERRVQISWAAKSLSKFLCTRRKWRQNTTPYAPQTHIFIVRATLHQRTCVGSRMRWAFESAFSQKSSCRHMFHRNLLGVPDPPLRFPTALRTASGTTCADPRSGSWFGRMAERSPLTLKIGKRLVPIHSSESMSSLHSNNRSESSPRSCQCSFALASSRPLMLQTYVPFSLSKDLSPSSSLSSCSRFLLSRRLPRWDRGTSKSLRDPSGHWNDSVFGPHWSLSAVSAHGWTRHGADARNELRSGILGTF